ncbi:TVP38/TMEM64 family protein [Clostridium sp.]
MKNRLRFLSFLILLITGFSIIRLIGLNNFNPQSIKSFILSFGWKAPLIYILLYTIRPLFLFPASLLSLSGGLTFGPIYGTLYGIIGASLGAYLSFFVARKLGMEVMHKLIANKASKITNQLEHHGFRSILLLRLIHLFPFDAISYAAGLSSTRFISFALGTTLGIIPGSFVYNFLGNSFNNLFSKTFYLALLLLFILILIPVIYKKYYNKQTIK